MSNLSIALVRQEFQTHLYFVGDPELPGVEERFVVRPQVTDTTEMMMRATSTGRCMRRDLRGRSWTACGG